MHWQKHTLLMDVCEGLQPHYTNKSPSLQVQTHPLLLHFIHPCSSLFLFIQSPNAFFRCVNHLKALSQFPEVWYSVIVCSTSDSNKNELAILDPNPTPRRLFPKESASDQRARLTLPISRRIWLLQNLSEFPLNSFYEDKTTSQTLISILSSSLNSQPHQRLFACKQIRAVGLFFL